MDNEGRMKALEATLTDLTKRFGDGTVIRLGDASHMEVDVIPSGSLTVDIALGVGGMPRGRITEIYGPESSGKTTVCLHVIAEAQKRGGLCAFVDMEHALDPQYARAIGVNVDTLYISQPDTAEQALEITEALVRSGALDVIVMDSVAALVPRVELEGEMGDSHVGIQARLMSQALRKLSGAIKQSNVSVMFTNQLRDKIGVMYGCLPHDSYVTLADGSERTISEIVNQKQAVEVLSYNAETGIFEPKPVINWFKNGQSVDQFSMTDDEVDLLEEEYLTFVTSSSDASGYREITSTPNHTIATTNGYQFAEDLELGDSLIAYHEETHLEPLPVGSMLDNTSRRNLRTNYGVADSALATLDFAPASQAAAPTKIVEIRRKLVRGKGAVRYNLQVADNANYVANGVVVHNSPETTSGGKALKFYASVRLDIRRLESIKASGGEVVGNRVRIRVTKNKVAPPFREAEFDIMFLEGGISKSGEVLDLGAELGIIEKRGAFYRYREGLLGQGRENAKAFLTENKPMRDEIEDAIRVQFGMATLSGAKSQGNGKPAVAPPLRVGSSGSAASADEDE